MMLLFRPPAQMHVIPLHHQVMVGRRDIDASAFNFVSVRRVNGCQDPRSGQQFRKIAFGSRREVKHNKNRAGEIGREVADKFLQGFNPASRSPQNENIVVWHLYWSPYCTTGSRPASVESGIRTVTFVPSRDAD